MVPWKKKKFVPLPRAKKRVRRVTDITKFKDYRDYLKSQWTEIKKTKPTFSYEYCARKMNLTKAQISRVLTKKRHFSSNQISKCLQLFQIYPSDREFFFNLYWFSTTEDRGLRRYHRSVLDNLIYERNTYGHDLKYDERLSAAEAGTMANLLRMTIHAMSHFPGFSESPEYILPRLRDKTFSADDVHQAVQQLIDDGFLERVLLKNGEHRLYPREGFFRKGGKYLQSARARKYEGTVMGLQKFLHEPETFSPNSIMILNFPLTADGEAQLRELFNEFEERLWKLANEFKVGDEGRVYNFCKFFYAAADSQEGS